MLKNFCPQHKPDRLRPCSATTPQPTTHARAEDGVDMPPAEELLKKAILSIAGGVLIIDAIVDAGISLSTIMDMFDAADAAKKRYCDCARKCGDY
jgi:hypothetical protein